MLPVCGLGSYFDNKEFVLLKKNKNNINHKLCDHEMLCAMYLFRKSQYLYPFEKMAENMAVYICY